MCEKNSRKPQREKLRKEKIPGNPNSSLAVCGVAWEADQIIVQQNFRNPRERKIEERKTSERKIEERKTSERKMRKQGPGEKF